MDKVYNQKKVEQKWYKFWEESGFFKPEMNPEGKPYTIILPPPNANAPLHFGHAMYVIEDILIRYHRMRGEAALWLPGADHAGFETQVVFEKQLEKEGKSRFDYDRNTLYEMIWDFVQSNRGVMESQVRRLGFSVDWSRYKFTLDPDIIKIVYKTFKKMFDGGLIYRAKRLVNYCVKHGTSFSDLEVIHEEQEAKLYFIKYPLSSEEGYITIATTRPETMLGDVAVAVNPKDKRYKDVVGKTVILPIMNRQIKIITDDAVDIEFGTGAVKITPFHDQNDYEIAQRHDLEGIQVIDFDGRMTREASRPYEGLPSKEARLKILEELGRKKLIADERVITHQVPVCYKCQTIIEPLPLEQWFINVQVLKKQAIEIVKHGGIKIYPRRFEKHYFQWLENLQDWNISRQIVWGIKIPIWYQVDGHEQRIWISFIDRVGKLHIGTIRQWLGEGFAFKEIEEGIQRVRVITYEKPENQPKMVFSEEKPKNGLWIQETDTLDTWFSSGQWPFVTLQTTKPGDFEKFYPTSVMETGYDILKAWVSRMVTMGLYATGKIPFKDVVLHGMVLDPLGKKMSKSRGNVVNPMEIVDQYGADALRMALVYGTAFGHDQSLSHPKLQAMRNFTNKLWNIGRFIIDFAPEKATSGLSNPDDKKILEQLEEVTKAVTKALDQYRFHEAADSLYEFIWHQFADIYIESTKDRRSEAQPVLEYVFKTSLELLHPFMPFITEELWQKLPHEGKSIMLTKWPKS